jgi:HNH endonuclease
MGIPLLLAKTYQPVGSCIYCGASEWRPGDTRKLGDEHIIPESLGGKLLLPESSCEKCERETSGVELEWLQSSYYAARVQKGLGKKKKRPQRYLPLQVQVNGKELTRSIPIEKYPAITVTLVFDRPGILLSRKPVDRELAGGVAIGTLPTFGQHLRDYLAQGSVSFGPHRKTATSQFLGRMLAKIAHSFAVAELGLQKFNPFLRPIILGDDLSHLAHYVGGTRKIPPAIADIYEIRLLNARSMDDRLYLKVVIRLLADLQGMPEYWVVVGEQR